MGIPPVDARPLSARPLSLLSVAFVLLAGGMAFHRPVDGDEGLYHWGAVRLAEGALPYRDFIYPQMPYLLAPYSLMGHSLIATRLLSVAFLAGGMFCLGMLLRDSRVGAVAAVLLLAANATTLLWIPTFKSYAFTVGLSLLACLLVQGPSLKCIFGAGLCLGLLVGTRLLYAPFPLIFAAWLATSRGDRFRRIGALAAGTAVAMLPCALLAMLYPGRFYYDVFVHHAIRSPAGAVGNATQKLETLARILLRPQWSILLVLALLGFARRRTPVTWLAIGCGASLAFMSLLPTPTYEQYFVCIVPFVLIVAAPLLEIRLTASKVIPALLVFGLYVGAAPAEMEAQLEGWPENDLTQVRAVSEAIARHTEPGEEILAFWAGYAVLSRTRVPAGMDNCCAYWLSLDRMTPAERAANGIPEESLVKEWVRTRRYRVVQLGSYVQTLRELVEFRKLLREAGYRCVFAQFNHSVHVRD